MFKAEGKSDDDYTFLNGAHPRSRDGAVAHSAPTEGVNSECGGGEEDEQALKDAFEKAVEEEAAANQGGALGEAEAGTMHASANGEKVVATATANLQKWWGQQIPFKTIVSSGALKRKADGTYGQNGGFTMGWDNCSNTPYLFNVSQKTVVTYDGEFGLWSWLGMGANVL